MNWLVYSPKYSSSESAENVVNVPSSPVVNNKGTLVAVSFIYASPTKNAPAIFTMKVLDRKGRLISIIP